MISPSVHQGAQDKSNQKSRNFWVAIDTEFTSLEFMESIVPGALPEVLSLGIVCQDGREFYGELAIGELLRAQCSVFVRETVLTQFGRVPAEHLNGFELACRATDFLEALPGTIDVVHDHSIDWKLLVRLLDLADPTTRSRLRRRNVWERLRGDPAMVTTEKAASFQKSSAQGIFAHHALADARALMSAFAATTRKP